MRKSLLLVAMLLVPAGVQAQELLAPLAATTLAPILPSVVIDSPPAPASIGLGERSVLDQGARGPVLGMFAAHVVLQALDVHSTRRAIAAGATESNPLMKPFAGNTFALAGVKAGLTYLILHNANRVSRQNRAAGIVLMAVMNSTYVLVVSNNYRIAGRLEARRAGGR